jgi:hypothetical protein
MEEKNLDSRSTYERANQVSANICLVAQKIIANSASSTKVAVKRIGNIVGVAF